MENLSVEEQVQHIDIDYSEKMPQLDFEYDTEHYPDDDQLPDPQINPIIAGAEVAIPKVGIGPVDLPVQFVRREGGIQELQTAVSLYGSLDNPKAKGLNLSRFYLLMHEAVANHLSIDGLKDILIRMRENQKSKHAYCKLRFKYPWVQEALRTRAEAQEGEEVFKVVQGKRLSHRKQEGHIFYSCELEGQLHGNQFKFYLTVDYIYASTCPCSFELSQDATQRRGKAANAHSQRSCAKIKIQFDPDNPVFIEDIVELARQYVPTEVQIVVKRRDEQAFSERCASNQGLIFTEDACRLLYAGLDKWYEQNKIFDFSIVTSHFESLHPWDAVAVIYKDIEGGLR